MTIEEAQRAVDAIRAIQKDDESAHAAEDELRAAFIESVADSGGAELAQVAKVVLSTRELAFARWYA